MAAEKLPDRVKSYKTSSKVKTKKKGKNTGKKVSAALKPKKPTKAGGIGPTSYVSKGYGPQSGSSQGSGGSTLGQGSMGGLSGSSTGS